MNTLLLICFVALCAAAAHQDTPKRRLIKGFPGLKPKAFNPKLAQGLFPGTDTWNAGYITFNATAANNEVAFNFFYWSFASRSDPANDPTIFWFTGGPGCASDLALFAENGPYRFTDPTDVSTLTVNPYSWNSKANLVFIDQPVGTGFSYSNADVYERNEDEVAADIYSFTQGFYRKYPNLLKNPLFVTGESYGGHYVPAISNKIVAENQAPVAPNVKLPFAGCAIGNGLVDPELQYPQYAPFAHSYGLISQFDVDKYAIEIKPCIAAVKAGAYGTAYGLCNAVMQGILSAAGIQNVYNVHAGCPAPPLCYNFAAVTQFLNQANVKQAIGVPSAIQWEDCNFGVNGNFRSDWMQNMAPRLQNVLAANHTVLIYSGVLDYICNYFGGRAWTAALQWPGSSGFNAAPRNDWHITLANGTDYKAAVSQVYDNFAWLEVAGAGHMVPMDQPQAALQMINKFTSEGWRA